MHLYQIIMVGTEKLSRVLWCKILDIWFLVHLIIHIFIFDFGRLQAKLYFLQKRQDNAVTWCILVLVTMLLNMSCLIWWTYHCLRVFRSRVKRIGKHSPGFSMFRTRVHGCSNAVVSVITYWWTTQVAKHVSDLGSQHNTGSHQDHISDNPSDLCLAMWAKNRIRLGGLGWGWGGLCTQ